MGEKPDCDREVIQMVFVKAAVMKDLRQGNAVGVEVGGKEIVIVNVDGKYFAIGDRCTHMSCRLSQGSLKGHYITCPCHVSVFDVETGNVVKGPAKKSEQVFHVKAEGDQILVDV
jgi:nitrite reductase/ring-hydroxylating ferredoxin subunit